MVRAQVVLPAPLGVGAVPHGGVREGAHGRRLEPVVEFRDLEQLEAELRAAPVAGHQGRAGREPAARALAGDGDPLRIHPDRVRVLRGPLERGVAVLDARRERMLGGEPVLHGHRHRVELRGDPLAPGIHHGDVAEEEAAAVDLEDRGAGPRGRRLGSVDPDRHLRRALRAGDGAVLHLHVGPVLGHGQIHEAVLAEVPDLLGRREVLDVRELGDQVGELGVVAAS